MSVAELHLVAFQTILGKEIRRFVRIWQQTILPPAITMSLYLLIFGNLIGTRVGEMGGFPYMDYIAPGVIMMAVITSSYSNVVSSFFGARHQRFVEEMLISPTPHAVIILGYVGGGLVRGLAVRSTARYDRSQLASRRRSSQSARTHGQRRLYVPAERSGAGTSPSQSIG